MGRARSIRSWVVQGGESGERLGSFLARKLGSSSSQRAVKRELERGRCRIDGERETFTSRRLKAGELVELEQVKEEARRLEIQEDRILHEDEHYLVYDKPPGHPSQPTRDRQRRNVYDELVAYVRRRDGSASLFQVHRLDRDTSGVLLLVKNRELADLVIARFAERRVEKTYLALVEGCPLPGSGRWESWLGRGKGARGGERRRSLAPGEGGKEGLEAITDYEVVEVFGRIAALVELHPRTGRTHQLRVHLSEADHPIIGDVLYASRERPAAPLPFAPGRHLLHATAIELEDPATGEKLRVQSPVPADMKEAARALRSHTRGG